MWGEVAGRDASLVGQLVGRRWANTMKAARKYNINKRDVNKGN